MRSQQTAYAGLPGADEPVVVVFVVSDDPDIARRVRAVAMFIPGVHVVDIRSVGLAVEMVHALYESPHGCPDMLLIDRRSCGVRAARAGLAARCPGVRVFGYDSGTSAVRLESTIRRGVRDVLAAIA